MSDSDEIEWHETTERFDKGKHGKDYELEISKFLLKRLIDSNFKSFKFTREKKEFGKFDDLTYSYETDGGRKKFGLQLKHISDERKKVGYEGLAKNKKSYFLLPRYFNHYLESLNIISTDKDCNDTELEALIICTNIGLEDDLQQIQKQQINNDGIFKNSGILYKFEFLDDVKRKIFAENYLTARKKLANELTNYLILNKQLDIAVLKVHDHLSMIKNYHVALAKHVIDPRTKKFRTEFLKADVNEPSEVSKFRDCLYESISEFYDDYKDLSAEELATEFEMKLDLSKEVKNRLSDYKSTKSIEEFLEKQIMNSGRNFGNVSSYPNDLKTLPAEENIVTDEVNKKIDDFLKLLIFASEQRNSEAIIRNEMSSNIFIDYNAEMNRWYYGGCYEDSGIRKRNWITKKMLLSKAIKSTVIFQGKKVKLNQLVCNESLLDPNILLRIFCSEEITVGQELSGLGDMKDYYISRVLSQQRSLRKDVLEKSKNDVFIVSNVNESHSKRDLIQSLPNQAILNDINSFQDKSRFVSAESGFEETHFKEFVDNHCKSFYGKSIHWLKYDDGQLLWQGTYGSLSELQTYFYKNAEKTEFVDECDVSSTRRFIIIAGKPGMGKSTLFNNIIEKITKDNETEVKPSWKIKILLKDCADVFKSIANCKDLENIADFLGHFENANDNFSKNLLKQLLMNEDRIILFLDGFDEMYSLVEQEKIIELLNFLKYKTMIKQIWITSRPHYKERLENCLGVVSFSMEEINEKEQVFFLSRYWKLNSNQSEKKLLKFAKKLIKEFTANINNQERSFLGVPLQTYMFAVGFLEEVRKGKPILPKTLPITSLFEKFLQIKYGIYLEKSGHKDMKQKLFTKFLDVIHQESALRHGGLLSLDEAKLFNRSYNIFKADELLDIGLIYIVKDTYHFIHKTFAEYLTAKRFVEMSLERHELEMKCIDILKHIILKPENMFLLYLFDLKLSKEFPLHNSVLNGDMKGHTFNINEINAEDCLGRTPLYYALQYRHSNITNSLIEKGTSVDIKDKFLIKALTSYVRYYYQTQSHSRYSSEKGLVQTQEYGTLESTHRNLAEYILKNNVLDYPVELFDVYVLFNEMLAKNWRVVELLIKCGWEIVFHRTPNILLLRSAPLEVFTVLIDRFRNNEKKTLHQIQSLFDINSRTVLNYLLTYETDDLAHVLQEYAYETIDSSLLGIIYFNMRSSRISLSYFDLLLLSYYTIACIYPPKSFNLAVARVKKRSQNLTLIVNAFFVHNLVIHYNTLQLVNSFDIQFERVAALRPIDLNTTVTSLKERVGTGVVDSYLEAEAITDLWSVIKEYEEELHFDTNMTLKEAIHQLVNFVLNSSDGFKLIHLVNELYVAVQANDIDGVSSCLLKAEEHGWVKALLNARHIDFNVARDPNYVPEMAQEIALRKDFKTILEKIATYREKSK